MLEDVVADDDRQHSVAQKLQPLIVGDVLRLALVGVGGMGQRRREKILVLKMIAYFIFQFHSNSVMGTSDKLLLCRGADRL